MSDNNKFIILDRENDFDGAAETKADAIEKARRRLADGGSYAPYTIYEAVAKVERASPPVTVIDL